MYSTGMTRTQTKNLTSMVEVIAAALRRSSLALRNNKTFSTNPYNASEQGVNGKGNNG